MGVVTAEEKVILVEDAVKLLSSVLAEVMVWSVMVMMVPSVIPVALKCELNQMYLPAGIAEPLKFVVVVEVSGGMPPVPFPADPPASRSFILEQELKVKTVKTINAEMILVFIDNFWIVRIILQYIP